MVGMETPVEMARRHISEAEQRVQHQREIIAELKRDGHNDAAETASDVLRTLEESLALARQHLELELRYHGGGRD